MWPAACTHRFTVHQHINLFSGYLHKLVSTQAYVNTPKTIKKEQKLAKTNMKLETNQILTSDASSGDLAKKKKILTA